MSTPYRLTGRHGQKRRKRILLAEPLCRMCASSGRITAAVEVDHIIALRNGGADTDSNLQSLCRACHLSKTLDDMGQTRRAGCDEAGLPVDPAHPWNG